MVGKHTAVDGAFSSRITETFGDEGSQWLSRIDGFVQQCASNWKLRVGDMYPNPSYQLVFRATGPEDEPYVLKLGVPRVELRDEAEALRLWAGRGTVRLVADDPAAGALLLERVDPGTQLADLAEVDDDHATEIGSIAIRRVAVLSDRASIPGTARARSLPSLDRWGAAFDRFLCAFPDGGQLGLDVVLRAKRCFFDLDETSSSRVVLHGDLHHHNILRSGPRRDDWLVIDPKGIVGDPAFEAGAFLRNPGAAFGPGIDGAARTRRRIDILTATSGLDRERLIDWAWAGTVLSAVWCVETDGPSSTAYAWPMQVAQWIGAAK